MATGDQVAVFHHLLVQITAPRIFQFLDNGFPARHLPSPEDVRRDEQLGPVADGKHRLSAHNKVFRKSDGGIIGMGVAPASI